MNKRVCPWWLGYFLISPLRRWAQNPAKILDGYVREGMTVLEPGPGMGHFTLELARRVGPSGRVVAVDVQAKMLQRLTRRAAKAGLLDRIEIRQASPGSMSIADLAGKVDFTLAFALVHEVPDASVFFAETATASRPGAQILFAEPKGHLTEEEFTDEVTAARQSGFILEESLSVPRSYAILLKKA